jgi:hypothetical protein
MLESSQINDECNSEARNSHNAYAIERLTNRGVLRYWI